MTRIKKRDGSSVSTDNVNRFIQSFYGRILFPHTSAYRAARVVWNKRVSKSPGLIVQCLSTDDIAQAVVFARENDVVVAVKGGGHHVAGHALCDDGLVIDLSLMKQVTAHDNTPTVTVQGGALLEDLDRVTHRLRLAVPTGVVPKIGVAGLTLGGGYGWLSRKYGLTCDNLLSCDVVTAEGTTLTAHQTEHADLFWALRGGAGNFGIVSSLTFRAHPVSKVYGGVIAYPRSESRKVLRAYRDFMFLAPDELTVYAALMTTRDGKPAVALMMCYCGPECDGERVIKPMREFGTPLFSEVRSLPFPDMQRLTNTISPDGASNYLRSTFVSDLSNEVIDLVIEQSNAVASPLSMVQLQIVDGAVRNIAVADTAYSQRDAGFNIAVEAKWIQQEDGERYIGWVRNFASALQPYSAHTSLVNFLGDASPAEVRAAFGNNYERLAQIKAKYDPTNLFRLNPNIEPRP